MVFLRQRELQLIPGASTGMHGSSALKEKMENQVSEERAKSKGSETWSLVWGVGWGPGNTGSHCCTAWLDPVLSYWVLHSRADSQEKYVPTKTASTLRCLLCPLDFSYLVNVKGHVAGDAQQMQKVTSVQAFNKTKASYF